MRKTLLLASTFGFGLVALSSAGQAAAPATVPVPSPKPALSSVGASAPSPEVTGGIPRSAPILAASQALKAGLDALSDKKAAEALAIRDSMPDGLDRHMLTWSIAVSGMRDIPSSEIAAAQRELKGWPGLKAFRANSERALYRENPPAADVIAAFGPTSPETTEGTVILARALVATGEKSQAARLLRGLWRGDVLDTAMEDRILDEFAGLLTPADHKARMDYLLYRGRMTQAKRFSNLGNAQSLYNAWSAVLSRSSKAAALLQAVDPSWQADPAYLFARIEQLRRQDKFDEAAKLIAKAPNDPAKLVNTSEWWNEQRIVARGLADRGEFQAAYKIAAGHFATSSVDVADAEFHAGWYALRGLNDPALAAGHFRKILQSSSKPISASRAWYWLGRASEVSGDGKAQDYFTKASRFASTFYGQLAAARLKHDRLDIPYPMPSNEDRQNFAAREAVQAIARFEAAGHGWRAESLYRALAEQLDRPGELALLTAKAEKSGDHHLSLQIGKIAFARGIDVPALAFPIGVIPATANIAGSGKALAYAIARQESAFNPAAVSPADARGLLQLMPGTAKAVAKRHGLAFAPEKLTRDAAYNATLGAHYLGEQIDAFGGSYVLTFIAYNAGPKRVPEWISRYGDPRGLPIDDVVDWIERIPFPETRNYVQRIMENYQIYKSRLGQKTDIVADLRFGR
ncbi:MULTISPECIES: lytic transglycosylase domain-containing protein [Alphaproteobacteria]|nr:MULTISPECIES: lytic transglycosylase domain-containing protein [Alphaproteobacteria]